MPTPPAPSFRVESATHLEFLEALPAPLWIIQEGIIIFANAAALTLLGAAEASAIVNHPLTEFLLTPFSFAPQQTLRSELRHLDGTLVQVQIKMAAGPALEKPTIILTGQLCEKPFFTKWFLHKNATQAFTEGVMVQNRLGEIILCNPTAEELLGLNVAQLTNQPKVTPRWRAIQSNGVPFPEEQQPAWVTLRTGKAQRHVVMGVYKQNGDLSWLAINSEPLEIGADGLPEQVISTYTDITYSTTTTEALQNSQQQYQDLIASIRAIIWKADAQTFQFSFVNSEAEALLGYPVSQWLTDSNFWADHIHPEDRTWAVDFCVMATRAKRRHEFEYRMIAADGRTVWLRDIVNVTTQNDLPKELIGVMVDITERKNAEEKLKQSVQEKEVILREIYHRVKNNLQVMSSLLEMQAMSTADPQVTDAFRESGNRIYSMALVHEELYQSNSLAELDFKDYAERLILNILNTFKVSDRIKLTLEIAPLTLNVDTAIPCGLILNELVSNAIKYAFPQQARGEIKVICDAVPAAEDLFFLRVCDNGVGLPPNVNPQQHAQTLGLELVNILTKQLKGTLAWENNGGANFVITFTRSSRPTAYAN